MYFQSIPNVFLLGAAARGPTGDVTEKLGLSGSKILPIALNKL